MRATTELPDQRHPRVDRRLADVFCRSTSTRMLPARDDELVDKSAGLVQRKRFSAAHARSREAHQDRWYRRGFSTSVGIVPGISSATVSPSKEGGVVHLKSAHKYRRQHVELLISLKSGRRARQGGDEKTAACMQCSSSTCWWCFGFSWCQVA
jgi:hypothetical protein